MDMKDINTTALAYIGDAVYEVYVRQYVLDKGLTNTDIMHRKSIKYVSANGQAYAIKKMYESLTEDEKALVKRARNHKSASKPKNTDPMVYKWATAFEALIGSLHISGELEREKDLVEEAIRIIEKEEK